MAIARKAWGEDDPDYGGVLVVLGDVLTAEGRPGDAVAWYRNGLAVIEKVQGPDAPRLIDPLVGLCDALAETGDGPGAAWAGERAVRLAEKATPDIRGRADFCLAKARWAANEHAVALTLARGARARLAAVTYASRDLARIDRWLADHR